ncbi:MAG: PEP-CTERM sorting domain-containing protein [Myxacorys chilensis ATA2-1-KO14]|nr:PEP-CTERM sorting domain-containing protein [Myxacorys chilensis ATA2-1-KO14]
MAASAQAGTLASLSVQQATPYDEYVDEERQKQSLPSAEDFTPQQVLQAGSTSLLVQQAVQQPLESEAPHVNSFSALRAKDEVIIKSEVPLAPKRVEVPEPSVVLGLITIAGLIIIKRPRVSND